MSTFLTGYILFSLLVLGLFNYMLRKKKQKDVQEEETVVEKELAPQAAGEMALGASRAKVVATIMLGAFVAILNQTLINVALPHMMGDLNVETSTIQWLVTGYMLVNGVLIPISPFLIAKFPTKK